MIIDGGLYNTGLNANACTVYALTVRSVLCPDVFAETALLCAMRSCTIMSRRHGRQLRRHIAMRSGLRHGRRRITSFATLLIVSV